MHASFVFALAALLVVLQLSTAHAHPQHSFAHLARRSGSKNMHSRVLNAHNLVRGKFGASPLSWDSGAAAHALGHARKCKFEHSSGSKYGENIAAGYKNAQAAISGWISEVKDWDPSNPGFSMSTGHFTQVVWKDTKAVGCGAAKCPGMLGQEGTWFFVCNYYPAGNSGGYKENVGYGSL